MMDKDQPCPVNFMTIRKQFLCFVKVAAGAVHAPIPLTAALQRIEVINAAGVNLSEHTKSPFLSDACPRKRHWFLKKSLTFRVSKKSTPCRQRLISFKPLTSRQKYKAKVPSAKKP